MPNVKSSDGQNLDFVDALGILPTESTVVVKEG